MGTKLRFCMEGSPLRSNSEKYHINRSNTIRYKDSAVPFLQRLLNKNNFKKKLSLKRLFNGKILTQKRKIDKKMRLFR